MTKIPLILFLVLAFLFAILAGKKYHGKFEEDLTAKVQKNLSTDERFKDLDVEFNYLSGKLNTEGLGEDAANDALVLANKDLKGWVTAAKKPKTSEAEDKPESDGDGANNGDKDGAGDTKVAMNTEDNKGGAGQLGIASGGGADGKGGGDVTINGQDAGKIDKTDERVEVKPSSDGDKPDGKTAVASSEPEDKDPKEPKDGTSSDPDDATKAASDAAAAKAAEMEKENAAKLAAAGKDKSEAARKALGEKLAKANLGFAANSHELGEGQLKAIGELAELIKDAGGELTFNVKGFAQDDCDSCVANQLSQRRAEAVIGALIRNGVAAGSLNLEGLPEPVGERPGDEKSSQRRVELQLVP